MYESSLGAALVLMLFFAAYFLAGRTPEKPIYGNYVRSRRLMGAALAVLAVNYGVHLGWGLRFSCPEAAILMNLSTYFLAYWLFSAALTALLDRGYLTRRRFGRHVAGWLAFSVLAVGVGTVVPEGTARRAGMWLLALWLLGYGVFLSRRLIATYRRARRLFDDTHSEDIGAYIRWMSIFTWWAVVYGVSCGLLTFLPERYVFLWVLSSIPFYIYLFCSYMNYLLFYEQVERILEASAEAVPQEGGEGMAVLPAFHAALGEKLGVWMEERGYVSPGLTIKELAERLGTNRTYLSAYIKAVYGVPFREWIGELRIGYAKELLVREPGMRVTAVSEMAGFLSVSYFTRIFTEKVGCPPSKWRKTGQAGA